MDFSKIVKEETYDFLKADVIQERIIKELETLLAEGVGDKAAERMFNIPDPNTEMDRQAMRGMANLPNDVEDTEDPQENEMGVLAGEYVRKERGKLVTYSFYKNPKSLQNFEKNVRAISNMNGDLFVAQMNGFFFHGDIADYINNMGEFHIESAYNQKYNITWHRVSDTNTFGLSISHMEVMNNIRYYDTTTKQLDAVRKKNPNFKFLPYHWTDVYENTFPENGYIEYIASLSGDTNEGVADVYAEKEFNIPNDYRVSDIKANSYVQQQEEEPVGKYGNIQIYKNPKSLENFDKEVRAVADKNGDLYVAQSNGGILHGYLAVAANLTNDELDVYFGDKYNYALLHRIGGSNKFGFGDTSSGVFKGDAYFSDGAIKYRGGTKDAVNAIITILRKTKQKNSQYEFYLDYYEKVNAETPEIDTYTEIAEGVGDVYAEKAFGIPDQTKGRDLKATSIGEKPYKIMAIELPTWLDNGGGERVEYTPVFLNPRSLNGFENDVRAISDEDGNIYVAQLDGNFVHGTMAMALGLTENDGRGAKLYHQMDKFQLLHRIGNTTGFGLADSAAGYKRQNEGSKKNSIELLRKVKARNPQFEFYPEYFRNVEAYNTDPIDANGNDIFADDSYQDVDIIGGDNALTTKDLADVQEGVADKYAEREFNISDPNAEMEKKAMSGIKDSNMGELVGVIRNEWVDFHNVQHSSENNVYMNPKTLQNFDEDVRAITDEKGNLFIGQLDSDYYHAEIASAVVRQHPEYDLKPAYGEFHRKILWHRVGLSREFGVSVSYMKYLNTPDGMERAGELLEAAQRKNPQFEFVLEYWEEM